MNKKVFFSLLFFLVIILLYILDVSTAAGKASDPAVFHSFCKSASIEVVKGIDTVGFVSAIPVDDQYVNSVFSPKGKFKYINVSGNVNSFAVIRYDLSDTREP